MASTTFGSLRHPNVRRFLIGQGLSQAGTWVQKIAISLLVLRLTDSGVALGLAAVAQFGPLLVLGTWAGVLCDRLDRHRMLLVINVVGAAVAAGFAALVVAGVSALWAIYVAALSTGVVHAFENPTRRVFLADLVDDDLVQNAVGLNSSMMTICEVTALATATALSSGPGLEWCFVVNAASFAPQLVLFARIDRHALRPRTPAIRLRGQALAGIRYAWATRRLRHPLALLAVVGMFGFGSHPVLVPLLAVRQLGGGEGTYALLVVSMSVGEFLGSLAVARRAASDLRFLARGAVAFGVCNVGLGLAPSTAMAMALAASVGFTLITVVVGINAWMQRRADPEMRGRVISLVSVVAMGVGAIGGPLVGSVAETVGTAAAFGLGGAVALGAGVTLLRLERRASSSSVVGAPVLREA